MTSPRFVWVAIALIVAGALGLGASTVLAQLTLSPTPDPLPGSNFQGGDGNQTDANGHVDWQGLQAAGRVGQTQDGTGNSDDSFTAGSEELTPGAGPHAWTLTRSPVTPKDDVLDVYRSFEHRIGHPAFVYLAFTRASGTGTTFLTFELNQKVGPNPDGTWTNVNGANIPCRATGDVLIAFTEHGTDTAVHVDEWVTSPTSAVDPATGCALRGILQPVTTLTKDEVQAAFNTGAIHNYLPGHVAVGGSIPDDRFAEAAINVTAVMHDMGEDCSDSRFISTWAHSRVSDTITSEMKDFVAPKPFLVRACKANPTLSSTTSRAEALGTSIFDTAHLSGGDQPTGTITFRLYRPGDSRCSRRPVFRSTVPVDRGNGSYNSASFTPTRTGTYRWRVTYSGDDNNHRAGPTRCGARSETVRVTRTVPTLTTEASGTTVLPNPINDSATLTGGQSPTGKITFEVFGPSDANCATPVSTEHVTVDRGNGTYTSSNFTPTQAGTWRWIATYSGDARNARVSTHCNDPGEDVVVDPSTAPPPGRPGLTTTATASAPAGSPIGDTAHLSGGDSPTGTITFYVYGPNDSTCAGPPAASPSTVPVSGAGDYHSAPFTPSAPGTYRWVAHYSGDANNDPGATSCNESGESSVVSQAAPSITTSASPATAPYGEAVGDTAVLSGGADPRGTITFRLYGPDDTTCTGPPAFVVVQEVIGNGSYPSPMPAPTLAGTYRWVATYSGDARNAGAATRCGDPGESVVVAPPSPIIPTPDEPTPKPQPTPKPRPKPVPPGPVQPIVTG